MAAKKNYILNKDVTMKKLRRMAFEIVENNMEEKQIILAGIHESGSVLAKILQGILSEISPIKTDLISISMDKKSPVDIRLNKNVELNGRVVIIVDDVANSGRTLLYAMKPFLEYHPKKIQTLVLVARSHKTYPVHADYVGLCVATTLEDHIYVEVEKEEIVGAYLG